MKKNKTILLPYLLFFFLLVSCDNCEELTEEELGGEKLLRECLLQSEQLKYINNPQYTNSTGCMIKGFKYIPEWLIEGSMFEPTPLQAVYYNCDSVFTKNN